MATLQPYGEAAVAATASTNLLCAGQYTDPNNGLIYLRARWYDPGTGQFLSVDPLKSQTGQAYIYARDNPVNDDDPTGTTPCYHRPPAGTPPLLTPTIYYHEVCWNEGQLLASSIDGTNKAAADMDAVEAGLDIFLGDWYDYGPDEQEGWALASEAGKIDTSAFLNEWGEFAVEIGAAVDWEDLAFALGKQFAKIGGQAAGQAAR